MPPLQSFQAGVVGCVNGRMAKARVDFTQTSLVNLTPFNSNYIALASGSIKQFQITMPNGMALKIKNLMYSFRPYYSSNGTPPFGNTDTSAQSSSIELQTNSLYVYNNSTQQYVSIAQSPATFQNYFSGVTNFGLAPKTIVVQGSVPFTVNGDTDVIDVSLVSLINNGTTFAPGQWGIADLFFCEFDVAPWNNTTFNGLVAA